MPNPTLDSVFGPNWRQAVAAAPGGMLQVGDMVLMANTDSGIDPNTGTVTGSNTPTSYTMFSAADHGKTNMLFDTSGGYQGSYKGADNFTMGDLARGAAVIVGGMLTGGALSGMAAGTGAMAGMQSTIGLGGTGAATGGGMLTPSVPLEAVGSVGANTVAPVVAGSGDFLAGAGSLGGGSMLTPSVPLETVGSVGSNAVAPVTAESFGSGLLAPSVPLEQVGSAGSSAVTPVTTGAPGAATPSFWEQAAQKIGLPSGTGGLTGNALVDAGIKYGVPLLGSAIQSNAIKSAANTQNAATAAANAQLQSNLDRTRADLEPWRTSGVKANNALADAAGVSGNTGAEGYGSLVKPFTGADLATEPGYQFGLNEGLRSVDRRAASQGSYLSGAALKGASRYATDYAGTKYNEAFSRDQQAKAQKYGVLSGMSSQGQNAAAMTGNFATNTANAVSNNLTANGNAQGAAQIAGGNAFSNAIGGMANTYSQDQMLQALMQQQGGNALQNAVTARIVGGNYGFGR